MYGNSLLSTSLQAVAVLLGLVCDDPFEFRFQALWTAGRMASTGATETGSQEVQ